MKKSNILDYDNYLSEVLNETLSIIDDNDDNQLYSPNNTITTSRSIVRGRLRDKGTNNTIVGVGKVEINELLNYRKTGVGGGGKGGQKNAGSPERGTGGGGRGPTTPTRSRDLEMLRNKGVVRKGREVSEGQSEATTKPLCRLITYRIPTVTNNLPLVASLLSASLPQIVGTREASLSLASAESSSVKSLLARRKEIAREREVMARRMRDTVKGRKEEVEVEVEEEGEIEEDSLGSFQGVSSPVNSTGAGSWLTHEKILRCYVSIKDSNVDSDGLGVTDTARTSVIMTEGGGREEGGEGEGEGRDLKVFDPYNKLLVKGFKVRGGRG